MIDITKCKGTDCPLKEHCYRYMATDNPFYQTYYFDVPFEDGECEFFIDVEHKNELL